MVILADILHVVVVIRRVVFLYILPLHWGRLSLLCIYYYEPLSVNTTDRWARRKNRNPPNLVTTKPFENYFRKYKTQFVWLYIFKNKQFFNVHLREAFKPPKNVLGILVASWMETETNTVSLFYIKQLYDPSFVSKRFYNFKRFQSDFLFFYFFKITL